MKGVPMSLKESLREASKTVGLVIGLSGTVFSGSKLMAQEKMEAGTASATITNIQTNILPFSVNSLSNNAVILSILDKIAETPEGYAALRDSQGDYMRHLILSNHPMDSLEAAWKKCYFNQGKRQINTFVTHDLLNDDNPEMDLFSSENITNDYNRLAELYAPYGITVGDIQKIAEKDTYMTAMTQILAEFHVSDDKARNAVDFYQNVENRYIDLLKKWSDKSAVSLQNRNQSER